MGPTVLQHQNITWLERMCYVLASSSDQQGFDPAPIHVLTVLKAIPQGQKSFPGYIDTHLIIDTLQRGNHNIVAALH